MEQIEVVGRIASDILALTELETIDKIQDVLSARRRAILDNRGFNAITTVKVGDRVRLANISPKYCAGAEGTVQGIERHGRKTFFRIELDTFRATYKQLSRLGPTPLIPSTCVEVMS